MGDRLTPRRRWTCVLLALVLLVALSACVGLSPRQDAGSGGEDAANGSAVVANDADVADEPPAWVVWTSALLASDLDGDGLPEAVELGEGSLRIHAGARLEAADADASDEPWNCTMTEEDGHAVCTATDRWLVSDCLVGDVDHDGASELVLLVWARGVYGSSKPFWAEDDTDEWSQHVYILHYDEDGLSPVWMSSALHFAAAGISLDGGQRIHTPTTDGDELVWAWQSWGLVLVGDADGTQDEGSAAVPADVDADGQDGDRCVTLLAVGDNLMHWSIVESARTDDGDYDFASLYEEIAPWARGFDIAVVGQEAPLLAEARYAQPISGAPFSLGDALVDAGFDVVLNASNHVGDFGDDALADELAFWGSAHPEVVALGIHGQADDPRYALVTHNDVTLALFDYTQSTGRDSMLSESGTALVDQLVNEERLVDDLAVAEGEADFSICFLHAGPEGKAMPDAWQLQLCERLVDAGADVIICAHAHEVMPFCRLATEAGNTGFVYFGLGNFVSNSHGADVVLEAAAALTLRVDASGAERTATVETAEMVPLVCHLDDDGTRVLTLASYTDELASANRLLVDGDERSAQALRDLWMERCLSAAELSSVE